jgi:hypothetical protein
MPLKVGIKDFKHYFSVVTQRYGHLCRVSRKIQMQKTLFLQGISGSQPCVPKRYRDHNQRVRNAVARFSSSEILLYLRSIAHLSFQ